MDPYSFNINTARELRLRRHIREVLLPYVRVHLTSDHVAFTEKAVEELLLQTLERVPMADATSFLLPTDPFEILMHSLHSLDLTPPEEKWTASLEQLRYLRTALPPSSQDLPTEKCWLKDDHYEKLSLSWRPISSPILSTRARRETPKFGNTHARTSIPRTRSALKAFFDSNSVSVPEDMDDFAVPPSDDVLDLRIKLDSASSARIRPFLQLSSALPPRSKLTNSFEDTPNVPEFLNHDSPSWRPPNLDSPPLFSRTAKGRSTHRGISGDAKSGASNPTCISHLASMVQTVSPELIDGEDDDMNDYHMEVVNGWTTLKFSSPPPPSLHSSDGCEIDELWRISPPGTPATSLMAAKMDEVEIPRMRTFGHKNPWTNEATNDRGGAGLLTAVNSPGFFITSFISAPIPMPQARKPFTSLLEGVESSMHSPHPFLPGQSTSYSVLGQPPSAPEKQANEEATTSAAGPHDSGEDVQEQKFDDVVAGIYISTPQDPLSYIIEEKLEDRDILLMDVPNLPPPTMHSKDPSIFPAGMQSFVAPKGELACLHPASHDVHAVGPTAFLRPVKGVKPLALDLSWRPFNFGKTIPTDEEVAGIARPIQLDAEVLGYRGEKYEKTAGILLDLASPLISADDSEPAFIPTRGCEELGTSPTPKRAEESGHIEYLLTRRERLRASDANPTPEAEVEVLNELDTGLGDPWLCNERHGDISAEDENLPYHGALRSSQDLTDPMGYHIQSRADHCYAFDDSGIDIVDNTFGRFSTNEFGVPHPLLDSLEDDPLQDDLLHPAGVPMTNKENVDHQGENKENIPPGEVDNRQSADPPETQYDWSAYIEFPESQTPSFEPLSFASQSQPLRPSDNLTNSKMQGTPPLTPSARRVKHCEDHHAPISECDQTGSRENKRRKLDDLAPASSKGLFSTFIALRNQAMSRDRALEHFETRNDAPTLHESKDAPDQILPRAAPDDVFDQHTVRLPNPWIPATTVHRYLASMTLIQKRVLVRELQGHHCRVDLVERYDLGGADIIVDPDSAVLFIPLLALPAYLDSTVERISRESWRYSTLLVVFEAFPSAQSCRADWSRDNRPGAYAYTPPICKAIKKLRRNLGIAEGCGTMNPRCTVAWAFANNTEEGAKFVRCFGEEACAISNERGREVLWDEREWLEEEEREGESDLAKVHGMNAFAAFVMLYDRSLDTILDLSPEARLADFGLLLDEERMTMLNAVIENRMRLIATETVVNPGC